MAPLLVSGITSLAGTLLDGIGRANSRRHAAAEANFAALLQQARTAAAPDSAATARENASAALRQRLLDSPELRTEIDSADPAHPPTLTLHPDGTVSAQSADGRTRTLSLSPETSATARELGATLAAPVALAPVLSTPLRTVRG